MDGRLAFEKSFSFNILSLKGSHSAKLCILFIKIYEHYLRHYLDFEKPLAEIDGKAE